MLSCHPAPSLSCAGEKETGSAHNEEGLIPFSGQPNFLHPSPPPAPGPVGLGSPEANRSCDWMQWAQVSFRMIKKKKNSLLFHFPFLIKKYAVGVPLWFCCQREDCP